jgi:hypothetical protein
MDWRMEFTVRAKGRLKFSFLIRMAVVHPADKEDLSTLRLNASRSE